MGFGINKHASFGLGGEEGQQCLPSGDAALRLMEGKPGALFEVAGTLLARSALMASGLALAGFRGRELAKGTLAAGLAVEAFVLGWAYVNKRKRK